MSNARGGALAGMFRSIPVTAWLITANLAVYLTTAVSARSLFSNSRAELFQYTALYPPAVVVQDQWWRLLTAAFQHFGPLHLLLNMYMLWILGMGIERSVGHARYLALFLVSAVGGSAAVMMFDTSALTAGASGGIFGLMGAYAIVAFAQRVEIKGIAVLIGLNVVVSLLVPGVSLSAHMGGLLFGALGAVALVLAPRLLGRTTGRTAREVVSWCAMAAVVALALALAWYAAAAMGPVSFLR